MLKVIFYWLLAICILSIIVLLALLEYTLDLSPYRKVNYNLNYSDPPLLVKYLKSISEHHTRFMTEYLF